MFGLGPMELIIILAIVMILFGVGKLPQIGEGMGKAIRNFKGAVHEVDQETHNQIEQENGIEKTT
jgi:sec-independent protein translocase protein TatA